MKLSIAIRLGAMMRPQGFSIIYRDGRTCAFGAAYDAVGLAAEHINSTVPVHEHVKEWEWVETQMMQCPVCHQKREVQQIISSHLNDIHEWTREKISMWVATIEPQEQPAPALPAALGMEVAVE